MPKVETTSKATKSHSASRGHPKPTKTKRGLDTKFFIINGHDYTNAQFEEIDPTFIDQVAPGLPKINALELFRLTSPTGPGGKYDGLAWRDLLAEPTKLDACDWLSMLAISEMTEDFRTNDDCKFRVWFCPPGLLHVEVDDDGKWTIKDIAALPRWMFMG